MMGGLSLILRYWCCYDVNFDKRMEMNELKDEAERWELRETILGLWIEFYNLKKSG